MRTTIKTIVLIAVLALLAASCSSSGTEEAIAAEPATTVATTTTEPPPDPADKAAATQQANNDAFLAQDIDALMATYTEDIEFFNSVGSSHWVGSTQMKAEMKTTFNMTDPDATEIVESFVSDDGAFGVVLAHWIGENGYGSPFDLTYIQLQEFDDGLISKLTMYWEDQDVWKQLSARPSE